MWAAPSGGSDATRGGGSADTIPVAAWQELGAAPKQQPQLSSALLQNAWRFLDRLHSSGAAAAAAEAGASPRSTTAALLGALPAVSEPAAASKGLGEQQLLRHQQQRSFLLLHRLLLQALLQAAPERAQQAVAQAAQLLPPLLADAASDAAAAEAAASRLQLLLAAVVQCHRGVAARAAAAQQQEQLLPLSLQQRLAACVAAANAIVHAAPWAFGLHQPRAGQQVALAHAHPQQEGQAQQRSMQEMMGLLQARAVLAAAQQQVQFMRHCCALHERAALELAQAVTAAQARQHVRAEAAQEASQQSLGKLLAADRLLRAAARHAGDEEQQRRARQWRDLRRGLTTGRGLWAEEEDREGEARGRAGCTRFQESFIRLDYCLFCLVRPASQYHPPRLLLLDMSCLLLRCSLPLEAGRNRRPVPPPPAFAPQLPLCSVGGAVGGAAMGGGAGEARAATPLRRRMCRRALCGLLGQRVLGVWKMLQVAVAPAHQAAEPWLRNADSPTPMALPTPPSPCSCPAARAATLTHPARAAALRWPARPTQSLTKQSCWLWQP